MEIENENEQAMVGDKSERQDNANKPAPGSGLEALLTRRQEIGAYCAWLEQRHSNPPMKSWGKRISSSKILPGTSASVLKMEHPILQIEVNNAVRDKPFVVVRTKDKVRFLWVKENTEEQQMAKLEERKKKREAHKKWEEEMKNQKGGRLRRSKRPPSPVRKWKDRNNHRYYDSSDDEISESDGDLAYFEGSDDEATEQQQQQQQQAEPPLDPIQQAKQAKRELRRRRQMARYRYKFQLVRTEDDANLPSRPVYVILHPNLWEGVVVTQCGQVLLEDFSGYLPSITERPLPASSRLILSPSLCSTEELSDKSKRGLSWVRCAYGAHPRSLLIACRNGISLVQFGGYYQTKPGVTMKATTTIETEAEEQNEKEKGKESEKEHETTQEEKENGNLHNTGNEDKKENQEEIVCTTTTTPLPLSLIEDEVIHAIRAHPTCPFYFVLVTTFTVILLDQRYTARPVLRWAHHQQLEPPTIIQFAVDPVDPNLHYIITSNLLHGEVLLFKYAHYPSSGIPTTIQTHHHVGSSNRDQLPPILFDPLFPTTPMPSTSTERHSSSAEPFSFSTPSMVQSTDLPHKLPSLLQQTQFSRFLESTLSPDPFWRLSSLILPRIIGVCGYFPDQQKQILQKTKRHYKDGYELAIDPEEQKASGHISKEERRKKPREFILFHLNELGDIYFQSFSLRPATSFRDPQRQAKKALQLIKQENDRASSLHAILWGDTQRLHLVDGMPTPRSGSSQHPTMISSRTLLDPELLWDRMVKHHDRYYAKWLKKKEAKERGESRKRKSRKRKRQEYKEDGEENEEQETNYEKEKGVVTDNEKGKEILEKEEIKRQRHSARRRQREQVLEENLYKILIFLKEKPHTVDEIQYFLQKECGLSVAETKRKALFRFLRTPREPLVESDGTALSIFSHRVGATNFPAVLPVCSSVSSLSDPSSLLHFSTIEPSSSSASTSVSASTTQDNEDDEEKKLRRRLKKARAMDETVFYSLPFSRLQIFNEFDEKERINHLDHERLLYSHLFVSLRDKLSETATTTQSKEGPQEQDTQTQSQRIAASIAASLPSLTTGDNTNKNNNNVDDSFFSPIQLSSQTLSISAGASSSVPVPPLTTTTSDTTTKRKKKYKSEREERLAIYDQRLDELALSWKQGQLQFFTSLDKRRINPLFSSAFAHLSKLQQPMIVVEDEGREAEEREEERREDIDASTSQIDWSAFSSSSFFSQSQSQPMFGDEEEDEEEERASSSFRLFPSATPAASVASPSPSQQSGAIPKIRSSSSSSSASRKRPKISATASPSSSQPRLSTSSSASSTSSTPIPTIGRKSRRASSSQASGRTPYRKRPTGF
ncbi:hypothetical protein QOT17_024092 [Balamuthia mandrillaris]